jgi:succinyl-CoA synthetase beta subunit
MQRILTEKEAEDFLEKQGFSIVKRAIAKNSEEIVAASKELKFPWVMKASSQKIVHKAKLGGVILNISSQIQAQEAFDKLSKIEFFEQAIIQEMALGEEIIIGLKKTPEFGLVIMFGKGGSRVEEEKDVSFRVLPASKIELKNMIKETKFYKILEEKQVNMKSIAQVLDKTAKLAKDYPNILEFDINPLIVNHEQAQVIDARIVIEESA